MNRKRVQRVMQVMGLAGLAPGPGTSQPHPAHKGYPYWRRDVVVERPNPVWCTDITYVPMPVGFRYLIVVMEWFSRYVLAWELSNTLEVAFCLVALERALARRQPEIFNSDQGAQFTSQAFTGRLEQAQVRISMDGRGRTFDKEYVSYCTFIVHSNTNGWRGRKSRAPGALRRWRTPGPVCGDGADFGTSVACSRRELRIRIRVYPSSDGRPAGPGGASAGRWRGEYPIARRVHTG